MGRRLRIQFAQAIYHVTSLGNRREPIFTDELDYQLFLSTVAEACAKTDWQVHAFCLLPDRLHLVIETPQPNLVAGMHWLQSQYANRFNRRHRQPGHVFAGRYRAVVVESSGGYLRLACDHVHLSPAQSGLLSPEAALRTYRWSSLPALLGPPADRPAWQRADRLLNDYGVADTEPGRHQLEAQLEMLRHQDLSALFAPLHRGWCLGSPAFKAQLLARLASQAGAALDQRLLPELAEAKAQQIIQEELARHGWSAEELRRMRKGDPRKLPIVHRLRTETAVTLAWIAKHLHMGSREYLVHLLYWENRPKPRPARTPKPQTAPLPQVPEPGPVRFQFPSFDPSFD